MKAPRVVHHLLAAGAVLAALGASRAAADPAPTSTASTSAASTVEVTVDETPYDALGSLLDEAAHDALNQGDYPRAWHFFWRLLQLDPHDARALREAGRVAHALGRFSYAERALHEADELRLHQPDPELHFLRAESLLALGHDRDAQRELDLTVAQLGPAPHDRRGVLWLARIAALRGDVAGSLALYAPLLPTDHQSAEYAEIMLYIVEAHILSKEWAEAERLMRQFRDDQPAHGRGREMMAWVLDARGKVDEELPLRAVLAGEWGDHPRKTVEYAQALERAYEYPEALDEYRDARALGVENVDPDIERLTHRLSPELGFGLNVREDASGSVLGWLGGATVSLGGRTRVAVSALRESSSGGLSGRERTVTAATAWGIFTTARGGTAALGLTGHRNDVDSKLGGIGVLQSSPERLVQLQVRAELAQPWRESSSTIREGGVADSLGVAAYASTTSRRLLFTLGGQVRRLGLEPAPGTMDLHARQLFAVAGGDFIVTSDPGRTARGQVLDGEMLSPASLGAATVVSFRHYESATEDPFGSQLVLVERSTIDEVSGFARHVLDRRGILAGEVRGGVGYDWRRDLRLWRLGASVLLSATAGSRLTLDYDVASESRTGLVGRRQVGSVVLHVDL